MVISLTTSSPAPHQREQVAAFLGEVLPRLEREPGVVAVYHFSDPETGESTTVVVWRDDASRAAYRESALIREVMAFEERLGLHGTRRAFPLSYPPDANP
ncbi:MAG: gwa2 protein [Chloroflexi bacterium CSP1-4]|nr:MAG: gwa2 protein [Chloroflexi bacterium CSP1-4]